MRARLEAFALSKITEKVILKRYSKWIKIKNVILLEQFGFRKNHSTVSQLARLTETIINNFNCRKNTGLVCIDLEKAFSSVGHTGLLYKLIIFRPTKLN
jgi:hypothetical protein